MNNWRHFVNNANLQHPSTYGFGYAPTHSDQKKVIRDVGMGLVALGHGGYRGDEIALCKTIFLPLVDEKPNFLQSDDFGKYFIGLLIECMGFAALYEDAIYNIFIDISDRSWFVNILPDQSESMPRNICERIDYILRNLNELDYNASLPENTQRVNNIQTIINSIRNGTRLEELNRSIGRTVNDPITLLDILIQFLVHSYRNLRIYVYKPFGRFATPGGRKGLGQYMRFLPLFQQKFVLEGETIMPLRKMLFRDAHHSRETVRSSRFSRTFFDICERNRRRVFLIGTSTGYADPSRHVNMGIPMRFLYDNQNQSTFGMWAGICSAYKPTDEGFPFLDDELLYQPFYELERGRNTPRIEFGEHDAFTQTYWTYGLDEYVIGTYIRKRMYHPEIWGEVDVYFHQINCLAALFVDNEYKYKDDGIRTKFKLATERLLTLNPFQQKQVRSLYEHGGISPYQDYLCLFASLANMNVQQKFIQQIINLKAIFHEPEDVRAQYHSDRLDRFDYTKFTNDPNDNQLSSNVSMNKQSEQDIFSVLNCALKNPPPVQARGNQPFIRDTAIIRCGGGRRKTISSSRRLLSSPKRKGQSSSSSSKKHYTRRRRALRSGKGGYRSKVTGRKV